MTHFGGEFVKLCESYPLLNFVKCTPPPLWSRAWLLVVAGPPVRPAAVQPNTRGVSRPLIGRRVGSGHVTGNARSVGAAEEAAQSGKSGALGRVSVEHCVAK